MTDQRTLTVLRKLIVDTVNADPHLPFGHLDDEVAERIAVAVLAQFEGVESGEVTTEWGVRWPDGDQEIEHEDGDEAYARRVKRIYPQTHFMQREVRRGPWTEAT